MTNLPLTFSPCSFRTQHVLTDSSISNSELDTPLMLMKSIRGRRYFTFPSTSCGIPTNKVSWRDLRPVSFFNSSFTTHFASHNLAQSLFAALLDSRFPQQDFVSWSGAHVVRWRDPWADWKKREWTCVQSLLGLRGVTHHALNHRPFLRD